MQISKVMGIKYIVFTDIGKGCIDIYDAVDCLATLNVILTYDNASSIERLADI